MGSRSMTVGRYEEIRRRLGEGRGLREIARALGCSRCTVREVRDGFRGSPDAAKEQADPLWMLQLEWPVIVGCRARAREAYLRLFADCGLRVRAVGGVDPAPFKSWLLPRLPRIPPALRTLALAAATLLSIPVDVPLGRVAVRRSWHAVFILQRSGGPS